MACSFVFCNCKPSPGELISYYNTYPRDTTLSSITMKRYEALCTSFQKFRKTNNILDIGCGDGHFLEIAKKNGWNVYGTEFTERAVEVCTKKGITTFNGQLSSFQMEPDYFDVITSFEVLEHINNPHEDAEVIARLMRPGGVLYITTPNFNSLSRMVLGPKWNVIAYPEHLCYYEKKTLKKLFAGHGFDMLFANSSGLSVDRFRRSSREVQGTDSGIDEGLRKRMEENKFLFLFKFIINTCLDIFNKGDGLKASFVKK